MYTTIKSSRSTQLQGLLQIQLMLSGSKSVTSTERLFLWERLETQITKKKLPVIAKNKRSLRVFLPISV